MALNPGCTHIHTYIHTYIRTDRITYKDGVKQKVKSPGQDESESRNMF